ncbi:hypothetical protein D3C85_1625460 [compost metagenome]
MVPWRNGRPWSRRSLLMVSRMPAANCCFSSGCRKFTIVVTSRIGALSVRPANWRIKVISYNASSMAGSLNENQFCRR